MQIVIVESEDEKRQLIDEIGADILPETYGGKAALITLQDFKPAPPEKKVTHES